MDIAESVSSTLPYFVAVSAVTSLFYYYIWLPRNWIEGFEGVIWDEVGRRFTNDHDLGNNHTQKKGREAAGKIQRRGEMGDEPPVFPNGWLALLESSDLQSGQVKHVQALGENFAVMRTQKGEVHILGAYCPHLGANMAVGGVVKEDCLECPFHGWRFRGEDGICTHIPYSDKVPKSAALKSWPCEEVNGFVFVWYHAEGAPPSWRIQPIPEIETGKFWYRGRIELFVNAHIQDIAENTSDLNHFQGIHSPSLFMGSNSSRTITGFHNWLMRHYWAACWTPSKAAGQSHACSTTIKLDIKLFNKFFLFKNQSMITMAGPGYSFVVEDWFSTLITLTPIEPHLTRIVFRAYCSPSMLIFSIPLLYMNKIMVERDIMVWNQKIFVSKPQLVNEDEAILRFRRWFSQFYSANSPRLFSRIDSLDW